MKAYLLYRNKDFPWEWEPGEHENFLIEDAGLDLIFQTMAEQEDVQYEIVKKVALNLLKDKEEIEYRQEVLKDCMELPILVQELNRIVLAVLKKEKESHRYSILSEYPAAVISESVDRLEIFMEGLKKLRTMAREKSVMFQSEGFRSFFERIDQELPDEYFEQIQNHISNCRFKNGIWMGTVLGNGLKDSGYIMLDSVNQNDRWYQKIFHREKNIYSFHLAPNDESGAKALSELEMKGLNPIANALGQSADHIHDFFIMLKKELMFYLGCIRLKDRIEEIGSSVCVPQIVNVGKMENRFSNLFDVSLLLTKKERLTGNDCDLSGKNCVIITGANQGGKTTFLRSLIQAQIMMQAGMFVGAEDYRGTICSGVFTHFKKKEDSKMKSGKLDEEMSRMDQIVSALQENAALYMNESFSSTNENEGSEIAKQLIQALIESNIHIYFVTHFYKCSSELWSQNNPAFEFMRAERNEDGKRDYHIRIGEPQKTSYGIDLYQKIFNDK